MQQANEVNSAVVPAGSGGEANGAVPSMASPASTGATGTATTTRAHVNGGRFDFDDGGTYCGGWEDGKAHGHGVCTGPKGQGAYSGSWHYGFEVSGVYTWPSGSAFEGQWQNGKRHGLGVETRGRWLYRGEWTQGYKGRYGVRQSATSSAKYEGTWASGLQDGYGSETYADGGTYQGQWLRGVRHGYGVRNSAPFGLASHYRANKAVRASLTSLRSNEAVIGGQPPAPDPAERRDRRMDDSRGGFVLKARSDEPPVRRRSLVERGNNIKKNLLSSLKTRKQRSTGDLEKRGAGTGSIRSTGSSASWVSTESSQSVITNASLHTDSNASFVVEDEQMDGSVTETYYGEWKNDKRTGFGISERSDGLKYEGEWFVNKKDGYGVTTFRDGSKEEGKYKNNVLITSQKKKHLFLIRSAKFRERIDAAVNAAQRASKIALQKADIAISRTATARGKAEQADMAADQAREDSDIAQATAKQFAPDFKQPGLDRLKPREPYRAKQVPEEQLPAKSISHQQQNDISNQIPNQVPTHNPSIHLQQKAQQIQQQQQNVYMKKQPDNYQQPPITNQYISTPTNYPTANQIPTNLPNKISQDMLQQNQQQTHQSVNHKQPDTKTVQMQQSNNEVNRMLNNSSEINNVQEVLPNNTSSRRNSKMQSNERQGLGTPQVSIDHFDHYKRPPSRDSSVDRYSRAAGRLGLGSRQPSVDKTSIEVDSRSIRAPSAIRGTTPSSTTGNGSVITGSGANSISSGGQISPPFEDILLRKRNLGQDIIPSQAQPKRTESLYINPTRPPPAPKVIPIPQPLQRKKSLPDVQLLPKATEAMSREEVSALGSARREEIRRQVDEGERLRANPLLYLVSPQVKDWFSRQQLVMLVLFINISLAIMFFKLLT